MSTYSLIEYKLRRYVFLGHEYNMYVPPPIRHIFWEQKHQDTVTGVRLIGKIVNKNKIEEIKSIVPTLLKIKQEGKLYDDRLLIFALAVCSKFTLKQCTQMVNDAYDAVKVICTDGLKLLMYVKFCKDVNTILFDEGYLSFKPSGFGNGFRKTISNWYLKKDPLLTTELILKHKCFEHWTHKTVMQLIHIHSHKPQQNIFIIYATCGFEKVKEIFGLRIKNIHTDNTNETDENKRLKFIYKYIEKIHNMHTMDVNTLRNEIELNRWGQQYQIVPQQMLHNPKILTSLVMHMPLATLLDKTYSFAKLRLFCNSTPHTGLREYILRFSHVQKLKESKIHPIESFLEYVKYSRTSNHIVTMQHNILKKQGKFNIDDAPKKIKVLINTKKKNMCVTETKNEITMAKEEQSTIKSTVNQENETSQTVSPKAKYQNIPQSSNKMKLNLNLSSMEKEDTEQSTTKEIKSPKQIDQTLEDNKEQNQHQLTDINQSSCLNIDIQQSNSESNTEVVIDEIQSDNNKVKNKFGILMLKPLPKLVDELLTFLSEELVKKTLQNMIPSNRRILISYDSRMCMKKKNCFFTKLLSVHEAMSLIILSLIYPETLDNKPTIYALNEKSHLIIDINYSEPLTFSSVESALFNTPVNNSNQGNNLDNLFSINWARQNKKIYDVFVILGTNQMNLQHIKKVVKEYRTFSQNLVKVIVCCLNGKHKDQRNLSMCNNMLFIAGFDKYVGKIIEAFINDDF